MQTKHDTSGIGLTGVRAREIFRQRLAAKPDRLPDLKSHLMKTERKIENLLRAVEAGRGRDALLTRLEEKEQRAKGLTTDIRAIESVPATTLDFEHLDRVLDDHLGRIGEVLRSDVVAARHALQKLLVDRVRFTPITLPDDRRTYRLEAQITLDRVLAAEVNNKGHVPDGI